MPAPPTRARRQTAPDTDGFGGGQTVLRHHAERDYVVITNAVARDARLSYRARGLLLEMISRPLNWKFSAERLARLSPKEGRDAIRTALAELRAAGYVLYARERSSGGRWRTVVTVSDRPLQAWADHAAADTTVTAPEEPKRVDSWPSWEEAFFQLAPETDQPASEDQASIEVRGEEIQIDLDKTRVPLASLTGEPPKTFDRGKRECDRELFADIIGGDTVVCDGRPWRAGRYTVDAFYNGLRKSRKVMFPGLYLAKISEDSGGIDDWLIDEGLEIVEHQR